MLRSFSSKLPIWNKPGESLAHSKGNGVALRSGAMTQQPVTNLIQLAPMTKATQAYQSLALGVEGRFSLIVAAVQPGLESKDEFHETTKR